MHEAADDFRVAILAALGAAPELIELGRIHRFSTSDRASDNAGWCQLFEDGRARVFGDVRSGISSVLTARRRELMTPAERVDRVRRLTATGWAVVVGAGAPLFTRRAGMRPLLVPQRGFGLDALWPPVNIPEADRLMVLAGELEGSAP